MGLAASACWGIAGDLNRGSCPQQYWVILAAPEAAAAAASQQHPDGQGTRYKSFQEDKEWRGCHCQSKVSRKCPQGTPSGCALKGWLLMESAMTRLMRHRVGISMVRFTCLRMQACVVDA